MMILEQQKCNNSSDWNGYKESYSIEEVKTVVDSFKKEEKAKQK